MYATIWQNLMARYGHTFTTADQVLRQSVSTVQLINKYTAITVDHLTPEIKLHLITPECTIWYMRADISPFKDPYWAFYWPGGQAISRYLLDHPHRVKNLKVLDVGCGCGACSIAASVAGAKLVIANDIDDVACTSVAENARLNNVRSNICISKYDFLANSALRQFIDVDCVLIGDMFYNEEFSTNLMDFMFVLLQNGKTILVGDPGRLSFRRLRSRFNAKLLAKYILPENSCLENNGFTTSSVWQFY